MQRPLMTGCTVQQPSIHTGYGRPYFRLTVARNLRLFDGTEPAWAWLQGMEEAIQDHPLNQAIDKMDCVFRVDPGCTPNRHMIHAQVGMASYTWHYGTPPNDPRFDLGLQALEAERYPLAIEHGLALIHGIARWMYRASIECDEHALSGVSDYYLAHRVLSAARKAVK